MTRREYFEKIGFERLDLKAQIDETFKLLDVLNLSTLPDGDENHLKDGKSDDILRDANKKLLEDYPRFTIISRKIRDVSFNNNFVKSDKNKNVPRSQTNKDGYVLVNSDSIYKILKSEIREENLDKILK